MNKKILISLSVIGIVAAMAIGATSAYFSDTETSSGNTFTAGAIDLKVDNTCHYDGMVCQNGVWVEEETGSSSYPELIGQPCSCTWLTKDLDGDVFFDFDDVKPGDYGEDTVSFELTSNSAWACLYVDNIVDTDNTCVEPEIETHGQTPGDPECASSTDIGDGELDENMYLTVWVDDDCDNILDDGEEVIINNAPLSNYIDGQNSVVVPVADSSDESLMEGPLPAGEYCIGIAWNVPAGTGNEVQTDKVGADLRFYVEQARNNPTFMCQPQSY